MKEPYFRIIPFEDHHQHGIDVLMAFIAREYNEPVFSLRSENLKEVSLFSGHYYWVACAGNTILGQLDYVHSYAKSNSLQSLRSLKKTPLIYELILSGLVKSRISF